jgi:hypothetical protein
MGNPQDEVISPQGIMSHMAISSPLTQPNSQQITVYNILQQFQPTISLSPSTCTTQATRSPSLPHSTSIYPTSIQGSITN